MGLAYFLLLFFGFQGVHQFYLGNFRRGFAILFLIHGSVFWFAWLEQNGQLTADTDTPGKILIQLIVILIGLLAGLGLWLYDLFTLRYGQPFRNSPH